MDTHYSTTFVSYTKVCILPAGTNVAAGVNGNATVDDERWLSQRRRFLRSLLIKSPYLNELLRCTRRARSGCTPASTDHSLISPDTLSDMELTTLIASVDADLDAAAAPSPPTTFAVTLPPGATAGQTLQATTPDGQLMNFQIPEGVAPGQSLEIAYTPAAPLAPPVPVSQPVQQQPTPHTIQFVVPPGVGPGMTIQLSTPDGQTVQVQLPATATPGSSIQVPYTPRQQPVVHIQCQHPSLLPTDNNYVHGPGRGSLTRRSTSPVGASCSICNCEICFSIVLMCLIILTASMYFMVHYPGAVDDLSPASNKKGVVSKALGLTPTIHGLGLTVMTATLLHAIYVLVGLTCCWRRTKRNADAEADELANPEEDQQVRAGCIGFLKGKFKDVSIYAGGPPRRIMHTQRLPP